MKTEGSLLHSQGYGLNNRRSQLLLPAETRDLSHLHRAHISYWAKFAPQKTSNDSSFLGAKRLGRKVNHSLSSIGYKWQSLNFTPQKFFFNVSGTHFC
jgi:hypothetical protein